ncbi:hypothetical protein AX17_006337 [Amanita inopinata Kibby_2008]|nr:hypothetical protein AX17_006337 [Amanita inopinata Kibby_2008]
MDDGEDGFYSRQTRRSVFTLAEFAQLVSAALDINSDRFPEGSLALTFDPDSPSSSSFSHDNCPFCNNDTAALDDFQPFSPSPPSPPSQGSQVMDSFDLERGSCVPGLVLPRCTPSPNMAMGTSRPIPSPKNATKRPVISASTPQLPTIVLTAPGPTTSPIPASHSKSRQVLNKIKRQASAFVLRTRTLSSTSFKSHSPFRSTVHSLQQQYLHPTPNGGFDSLDTIPTVSIAACYKNNVHLRSAISLVDLESFNNNSAYSLATNTADFYDDESDFVPYLPLACQYERVFPKSPSMPLLPSKSGAVRSGTNANAKAGVTGSRNGAAGSSFARNIRNRCTSSGNIHRHHSRTGRRKRTLSAATSSTVTTITTSTSVTDPASPVTPRSAAFLALTGVRGVTVVRRVSNYSVDSGAEDCRSDGGDEENVDLSWLEMAGTYGEYDDPFAKDSIQIIRRKSRPKASFQELCNPTSDRNRVNSDTDTHTRNVNDTNTKPSNTHNVKIKLSSSELAPPLSQTRSRSHSHSNHSKKRGDGRQRVNSTSPSLIPISRMKKTPIAFPVMPGYKDDKPGKSEGERGAGDEDGEDKEEWTLCLGATQTSEEVVEDEVEKKVDESEKEGNEPRPQERKERKVKISDALPVVSDHERGRPPKAAFGRVARRSVPQLRVTRFVDGVESEVEGKKERSGATASSRRMAGDDWTLSLPLYSIQDVPLHIDVKAKKSKGAGLRSASHSPPSTSVSFGSGPDMIEERRRTASCVTSSVTASSPLDFRQTIKSLSSGLTPESASRPASSSTTSSPASPDSSRPTTGTSTSTPSPPSSSSSTARVKFPLSRSRANGSMLGPPTSRCSNLSSSSLAGSHCSNESAESCESRCSRGSKASRATRTTSSTATVVPGPWQRDQMQLTVDLSRMRSPLLEVDGSRLRTVSTSSRVTMERDEWGGLEEGERSKKKGKRKMTSVDSTSLPFGRQADIRARTVSMGGSRRRGREGGSRAGRLSEVAAAFSSLSKGWGEREREKEREKEKEREREKEKEKKQRGRINSKGAPRQWFTVGGRRGKSGASTDSSGFLTSGGGEGTSAGARWRGGVLDDAASSCSGTYYSARSSFSLSG